MNIANIPNDKHEAEIHLRARKSAILELSGMFIENNIETTPQILGAMLNEIELIDRCLEFGVDHVKAEMYEYAAKADHRTDI